MKTFVVTAAFYDRDYEEKLANLRKSCEHFNIPLHEFGKHIFFRWHEAKTKLLREFIERNALGYSHVLYTDAADSFFLTNLKEIQQKYEDYYNQQLVVSTEKGLYPYPQMKPLFPKFDNTPYRYFNPGNFLGEKDHVISVLKTLETYEEVNYNDQAYWYLAYRDNKIDIQIDYECDLFQTMSDHDVVKEFTINNKRLVNNHTGRQPCIVHFNGGKDQTYINTMNWVHHQIIN